MNYRRILYLVSLLVLSSGLSVAAVKVESNPDKTIILDGHVVHDVGEVWNNVTNWGLIGSAYSTNAGFANAPSAQWPKFSGNEYLWAAGLWVGGVVQGIPHVTAAGYFSEFMPTEAPADTIYRTAHGATGGNRYPWPGADDDADGSEDEEILNGLDDDGDGLVDEDFAAIGDQHFICRYDDFEPALATIRPDHTPLNIQVVQQSIQWSSPLAEDFIGYDFTITNVGTETISEVYLALFSDHDIGVRGQIGSANDDMAGYISTTAQASDGTWVPVQASYMYDAAGFQPLDGYAGWVLCGYTTDPAGQVAPVAVGVHGFQRFEGNMNFAGGGDPASDLERYEALSEPAFDPDSPPGSASDYRTLLSTGPFPSLAPGQSLGFQVALVLGAGLDDMIANAAEAVAAYRGQSFDRDGDPTNGQEFTVHWLRAEEVPVAASAGWIQAQVVTGGVQLTIETNNAQTGDVAVVRRTAAEVTGRRWAGSELTTTGVIGGRQTFTLLDTDAVGWPRTYELVSGTSGFDRTLDQVGLDLPAATALGLLASPNPFNPQINIKVDLPQDGSVLLQAFDLRGRLVRTLLEGHHPVGRINVVWHGDDTEGRALASGVYQLRLTTAKQLVEKRVTLVR